MMSKRSSGWNLMSRAVRELAAVICIGVLLPGNLLASQTPLPDAPSAQAAAKIPADQLDSLVAPIALYPDPLLSQALVASTYPLEVIQLQQWLAQNKGLKDKALADAVKKQDWDPSIQGLAALPDVVKLTGRQHQVDHRPGKRLSRAAERCDGLQCSACEKRRKMPAT